MRSSVKTFILLLLIPLILSAVSFAQAGKERSYSRMDLLDRDHQIKLTDRLQYRVLEEQSPEVVLSSDSDGNVKFPPLLQSIPVVGKTCFDLAQELKSLLEVDFFYRATVEVKIATTSYREYVTIYGQVRNQGRVSLPQNGFFTISQLLSQVGGTTEGADLENVEIRRKSIENPDKEDSFVIDVDAIVNKGLIDDDMRLAANDVIIVGSKEDMGGRYSVLGAVNSPGLYTIAEDDLSVSDAILLAGGFTDVARQTKVKLTRRVKDSDESEIYIINVKRVLEDGDRSEDMMLKEDDIINVSEKLIVF